MFVEPFSLTALWRRLSNLAYSWWQLPAVIKGWTGLLILGLSLIIGAWLWLKWPLASMPSQPDSPDNDHSQQEQWLAGTATSESFIYVDVSGAVVVPGVYQLRSGQVVAEALARAGGVSQESDYQYLHQKLNLAEELKGGTKLYVPFSFEKHQAIELGSEPASLGGTEAGLVVSLNQASLAELTLLPGIGEKRANDIVQNRPYHAVDEVLVKKIIPASVFDSIKNQLTL
jgi:competence protein ComEA